MPELLTIERLSAGYGEAVVLNEVSLALAEGQSLALLGRNGMGKTTLINSIVGVTRFLAGRIGLDVGVGVVMGDEDRTQCRERDAGAGVLLSDADAAIEYISGAIAQHHVRGHLPGASWSPAARAAAGAKQDELGELRILQRGLRLLRRGVGRRRLRSHRRRGRGQGGRRRQAR